MQSRVESFVEAWINVAIGFWINFAANYFILPLFGFNVRLSQTFWIGGGVHGYQRPALVHHTALGAGSPKALGR